MNLRKAKRNFYSNSQLLAAHINKEWKMRREATRLELHKIDFLPFFAFLFSAISSDMFFSSSFLSSLETLD
jgi:hypothetical protein